MTTINLYQNKNEDKQGFSFQSGNKGFYFSLAILIITAAAYFGLNFFVSNLQEGNQKLDSDILTENGKLVGLKNFENVVDMQKRIGEIKTNLQIEKGAVSRTQMIGVLDKLSSDLGNGILVDEYTFDSKGVVVKFLANNFSDAARQINNFKNSTNFSDVNLKNISRQEDGISFEIAMKLK